MHRDAELRSSQMHELHIRYRPLKRVGVYCPGGKVLADYLSATCDFPWVFG